MLVDGFEFILLGGLFLDNTIEVTLELLDQLLLVVQLIPDIFNLFVSLLQTSVVFRSYFQLAIILLELLNLLV